LFHALSLEIKSHKKLKLNIRKSTASDFDKVWEIFSKVIKTGDTYVFSPNTLKDDLKKHWFAEYMETYVAEENGLFSVS